LLSTLLELAGFAAITAGVTLAGLIVSVLVGLASGLLCLGVLLVVLALAVEKPGRRR
jgi:hypothetical protein